MGDDAAIYTAVGESYQGYCCKLKHYYSQNSAVVNTLEITPRVIVFKRSFRTFQTFVEVIHIKNTGMYERRLKYSTDSSSDTIIQIQKTDYQEDLLASESLNITLQITPNDKQDINRRRHIFINSEHPNITFEIPIIVLAPNAEDVSIPKLIKFPSSVPRTQTFYEFVIFNTTLTETTITAKCSNTAIKYVLKSTIIPKRKFTTIFLALSVRDMNFMSDLLKLKIANKTFVDVMLHHEPIFKSTYLSCQHLSFEEVKFQRNSQKEFTACNESQEPLQFSLKFLTELTEIDDELDVEIVDSSGTKLNTIPSNKRVSTVVNNEEKPLNRQTLCAYEEIKIDSFRHFGINTKGGQIKPNSSNKFIVVFHPIAEDCTFDDDEEPPYLVATKLIFQVKSELETLIETMIVSGLISGPEVEFTPTSIDMRRIYLGEEYCYQITVANKDTEVNAVVNFKSSSAHDSAVCVLTPLDGFCLEPNKKGVFLLTTFTKIHGKFTVFLKFKVKNGHHYTIPLRGFSRQIRPKTFPDIIAMGSIPIAVPQRRQILLLNPLSVPMTMHLEPADDGDEIPLILDVINCGDALPITVRNPYKILETLHDEYEKNDEEETIQLTDRSLSKLSYKSCDESSLSSYSIAFEEEVLDPIPEMARRLVKSFKRSRLNDKSEIEKKVIGGALANFLELNYFDDFKYSNYNYMDWNALPSDPKELYVDSEVIYLLPNTGKAVTVLVIPNRVGYFSRSLNVRCCPYEPILDNDRASALVDSDLMRSQIYMEYNCCIPAIIWDDVVDFGDRIIYAYQAYPFDLCFENSSNIGGFIYFDVVPKSDDGEMFFIDNTWKYFLSGENYFYAYCSVIFKKIGDIKLYGMVKFLGNPNGKTFHIKAHVLPPKVGISVTSINKRQYVLEYSRIYIYIENLTPTRTWFTLSLKNSDFQTIEPEGGILAPTGQGICAILHTKYYDPEIYKNVLYLDVKGGDIMEIPIVFNIDGMPIIFEPNLRNGLYIGEILANSEEHFISDLPNYTMDIKVTNGGHRSYLIKIQKLKIGSLKCGKLEARARLNLAPHSLLLKPQSENRMQISANACDETETQSDFLGRIVDQTNKQRFECVRFVIKANFVAPELMWSRKEITMLYRRTHQFKEHPKLELVKLINSTDVKVVNVNLKVTGPFKIRELFEQPFKKQINFSINALERKEITIFLDKFAIKSKFCTHVDGRLYCTANCKPQRSLPLRVNISCPELNISQPEITLFTKNAEEITMVEIENTGCLEASYKWRKIEESRSYIADQDYPNDFAHEVLSEIFRMLDLSSDDESYSEPSSRENMSLRYQKYRCRLLKHKPIDPIGIVDIIYEIIDNLDLEHKRYIVRLNEDDDDTCESTESCTKKTIERILKGINLEDSYEVSLPSSESCDRERNIYFYEKSGIVQPKKTGICLVHLPPVRVGYEEQALFELVVIGGSSHTLKMVLVNLERTIELSRDSIYLGMKPWYDLYKVKVKFQNVTRYTINISLDELVKRKKITDRKYNRLADGYVEIARTKCFNLESFESKEIKFTGIMGFSDDFKCVIKSLVNDCEEKFISLRGQGVMQIFSLISGLKRLEQTPEDIVYEYQLLRRIYYFEVFKGITEQDEELSVHNEEGETQSKLKDNFSLISFGESLSGNSLRSTTHQRKFFRLLQTYIMVNHNEEIPNAIVLEQLMETEKFLDELNKDEEKCAILKMVYQQYLKDEKEYDPKMPFNLKHFMIQPLPFEVHGYILNMEGLKFNQYRKFHIDLQFYGPGKLIVAARTAVKIPGLTVDFQMIESKNNDEIIYYCSSEENEMKYFYKPYRNMYERHIDLENDPKLKHAHSFDVDEKCNCHKRMVSNIERKAILNYYNSLNKSVYTDRKHHCYLCKILRRDSQNSSGVRLRVILLYKPTKKYYDEDQILEDYLYIDIHMGPTLPILLRGLIKY